MLSVVIPALNEAAAVGAAVASAWAGGAGEVIVVDGGSHDATRAQAARSGAQVIDAPRGRAVQMNAGAAQARGEALLFLHADTLLPPGAARAVEHALAPQGTAGGCFRLRFDRVRGLYRLYSAATYLNRPGLVFGDRALFVRRAVFEHLGGYRPLPVFEDVDLVGRLHRHGRFCFLNLAVTTSARRFEAEGRARRQLRNISLFVRYHLGVPPERLAPEYRYDAPTPAHAETPGDRFGASL